VPRRPTPNPSHAIARTVHVSPLANLCSMLYDEKYWTMERHARLRRILEACADAQKSSWDGEHPPVEPMSARALQPSSLFSLLALHVAADVLFAVNAAASHSRLRMYESEIHDALAESAFTLSKDGFVTHRVIHKDPIEKVLVTPKRMRDEIDIVSSDKRVKLGLDIVREQPNAPHSPNLVDVHERASVRAR
jgi:hypothetical protein